MRILAYTDPALQGRYATVNEYGHMSPASDVCNAIINYCINYKPEIKSETKSNLDILTDKIGKIKCQLDCTVEQALEIIKFERGI